LDVRDVDGDYLFGMKTIPYYIGPVLSVATAFALMAVSGVVAPFTVSYPFPRLLSVFSLAILLLSVACWYWYRNVSIIISRVAFFLGGLALATTITGGT
jgi:1,4-dihydroxy-2-naphthoate octaprenyltransferase